MKAKEVIRLLRVSRATLCRYVKQGIIRVTPLPNKTYSYDSGDVFKMLGRGKPRLNVVYARVSSAHQKQSLENQVESIKQFMVAQGIGIDLVFKDISSGLHLNRKSLMKLVELIQEYQVQSVYILYKDRLARISFDLLEKLFSSYGTEIKVINSSENMTLEQELFEDIVSMIHSFSMKIYSRRKLIKRLQEDSQCKEA